VIGPDWRVVVNARIVSGRGSGGPLQAARLWLKAVLTAAAQAAVSTKGTYLASSDSSSCPFGTPHPVTASKPAPAEYPLPPYT
jgi:hypothetical protein